MAKKSESAQKPSGKNAKAAVKRSAPAATTPVTEQKLVTISPAKPASAAPARVNAEPASQQPAVAPAVPSVKKKAPTKKTQEQAAAPVQKPVASGNGISTDDIALRAYFISEKRRNEGLPGDEHQDWLEAERQLKAERQQPPAAGAAKKSRSKKEIAL